MRGTVLIKIGEYTYFRKRTTKSTAIWICSTHHCKGCTANVHFHRNTISKINNIHNHSPSNRERHIDYTVALRCTKNAKRNVNEKKKEDKIRIKKESESEEESETDDGE